MPTPPYRKQRVVATGWICGNRAGGGMRKLVAGPTTKESNVNLGLREAGLRFEIARLHRRHA